MFVRFKNYNRTCNMDWFFEPIWDKQMENLPFILSLFCVPISYRLKKRAAKKEISEDDKRICYFSYHMDFKNSGIDERYVKERLKEIITVAYKSGIRYFYIDNKYGLSTITADVLAKMAFFRLRMNPRYCFFDVRDFFFDRLPEKDLYTKFAMNDIVYDISEEDTEETIKKAEMIFIGKSEMLVIDKKSGDNDERISLANKKGIKVVELFEP